jgi:hypothetical protein
MVVFGFVAITLIGRTDNEAWDYWLLLAVWTVPFLTVPLGMAGIPASCLPVAALGGRLLWRLQRTSRDVPGTLLTGANTGPRIAQVPLANS